MISAETYNHDYEVAYKQGVADGIDKFLAEIDKAIIERKASTLSRNSCILDHVNDFDEVKRETLHTIAERLKESK